MNRQPHQEVDDDAGPVPASIFALVHVVRVHRKPLSSSSSLSLQSTVRIAAEEQLTLTGVVKQNLAVTSVWYRSQAVYTLNPEPCYPDPTGPST